MGKKVKMTMMLKGVSRQFMSEKTIFFIYIQKKEENVNVFSVLVSVLVLWNQQFVTMLSFEFGFFS